MIKHANTFNALLLETNHFDSHALEMQKFLRELTDALVMQFGCLQSTTMSPSEKMAAKTGGVVVAATAGSTTKADDSHLNELQAVMIELPDLAIDKIAFNKALEQVIHIVSDSSEPQLFDILAKGLQGGIERLFPTIARPLDPRFNTWKADCGKLEEALFSDKVNAEYLFKARAEINRLMYETGAIYDDHQDILRLVKGELMTVKICLKWKELGKPGTFKDFFNKESRTQQFLDFIGLNKVDERAPVRSSHYDSKERDRDPELEEAIQLSMLGAQDDPDLLKALQASMETSAGSNNSGLGLG